MDTPWLTPDQHAAVVAWARRHGPTWKERLRVAWLRQDCPEGLVLREMRESHGEDWLAVTQARVATLY
ncbi:hypothetical protein [Bradyrhizobium liaoningense]|uniref:hypothetical protein n=1 Tax=Bradyrhizobium liaoningense TaxID=43992 RepID=UPI001BA4B01A|nr:hypothetical protein [Bradyrhizobium liaoningense]MBR0822422.1 hypothetical protein [Bradyrhizobium liaoningense]